MSIFCCYNEWQDIMKNTCERIVGKLEEGHFTWGGMSLLFPKVQQHTCGKKFLKLDQLLGGRPHKTTAQEKYFITLIAKRNCYLTAGQVSKEIQASTRMTIRCQTIHRRLNDVDLFACKPVKCIPMTPTSKCNRYQWCREHFKLDLPMLQQFSLSSQIKADSISCLILGANTSGMNRALPLTLKIL